jgi:hypothetical protein
MSTDNQPGDAGSPPLANAYLTVGLGAVVVVGAALMHTAGRWALIPTLVGAAGLAFRWRSAPLVLLAAVALGQLGPTWYFGLYPWGRRATVLTGLGLCAATLAYVVAQYRLVGLTAGVFPPDPRKRRDKPPPRPGGAAPREVTAALLAVAAATVGAFFAWEVLALVPVPWHVPPMHWRLGLLAWVLLGGLGLVAAVLGHLGWRRLSREEAAVYLQDALWHETRGEQRRINRWRAWCLRRR